MLLIKQSAQQPVGRLPTTATSRGRRSAWYSLQQNVEFNADADADADVDIDIEIDVRR